MNFKGLGRKIWNGLPFISGERYLEKIANEKSSVKAGTLLAHMAYSAILPAYLVGSLAIGTLNPLGWKEFAEQRQREVREYATLADKTVNCAEQNGIPGFSNQEINELYRRAGIDFKALKKTGYGYEGNLGKELMVDLKKMTFYHRPVKINPAKFVESLGLTRDDLETAVQNCELEE